MRIGGLQRCSLNDYPGKLAAVVFTQGCALRCDYCHNPELVIPEQFCERLDAAAVLEFLHHRRRVLDGVVISGGDPVLQPDLAAFLTQLKELQYQIKLDTTGINPRVLHDLIERELVDYIAMDVKAPLSEYVRVAHNPIPPRVLQLSIETIMQSGIEYEFRTTIVRSQLSESDLLSIAQTIAGARHYYLQRFQPHKTLNPAFAHEESYTLAELQVIKEKINRLVQHCGIR